MSFPLVKRVSEKGKKVLCRFLWSYASGHWSYGAKFFWNEFILNYIIATYRKPQVSILNGIVMGGGAGVSIHGRFRVATENSVFAMPETSLGLFPDIGASYFLSRLPGYFGTLFIGNLFFFSSLSFSLMCVNGEVPKRVQIDKVRLYLK
ncbi:hypothetical protein Taro_011073 [Colocasia esculenta]|uniref:3-hydroxyisobutyryl-CoA hydrolase n=1 Tax=Colocasia esculenta TaxID=4460 RepID=A0A843U4W7_COLES|nr:hypothetical protein [Colocasia esculenta]